MNLFDICDIGGQSVKSFDGEKKYIATGDIINNEIISGEIVNYKSKPSRANVEVRLGDVLFAKMMDTVKVLKVDELNKDYIYSTGFYCMTPKADILQDYLYLYFNSDSFNSQKNKNCSGATQKAINNDGLSKIVIKSIPSVEEQKKIINKLSNINNLIKIKKEEIEKLNLLIKSQFVEMFENKNFDYIEIKNVVDNNILKVKKKLNENDVIKYIDISSIDNSKNEVIGYNEYLLKDAPSRAQQCIQKNDILISTVRPNLKNIAVNEYDFDNCIGTSGFCVLRANKCNYQFLKYIVLSERFTQDMVSLTTGANYPAIKDSDIKNYKIINPPIELQNKFAQIVEQIDKQKFEFENSLKKLEELQASLMQEYFG